MELLKPAEFLIASILVNRGELKFAALMAAAAGEVPKGTACSTVGMLRRRGLVERSQDLCDGRRRATYRITDHGRAAWTDTFDWYSCIARGQPSRQCTAVVEAPRLPTADERHSLLAAATPEFARLLAFCWAQPGIAITEAVQANIADFNRADRELTVGVPAADANGRSPRRSVKLTPEAAAIVAEAAGLRRSGVLFPAPRAGQFRPHCVTNQFRQLADRCGIPRHVRLRVRPVNVPLRSERDDTLLSWYEDRDAATFRSNAAIRDRWNAEHPDDPIPAGETGYYRVHNAIRRARTRRDRGISQKAAK
jgi:DNA-binding MarR family transcriptional regulator